MQLPFCFFGRLCAAERAHPPPRFAMLRNEYVERGRTLPNVQWRSKWRVDAHFYTLFVKKTVNKRRGIKILRSFVNP